MIRTQRRTIIGGSLLAIIVVATASIAFACTTYVGKMTVRGNAGAGNSVAQGNNNCDSICGQSNGSMRYCGSVTFAAVAHATLGTVTVTMGTTDICNAQYGQGENHLTPNAVYDINYRYGSLMSTTDTTITSNEDCDTWTTGNSTVRVGTALADVNGAFTKTVNLTNPTTVNAVGKYAAVCVADSSTLFGNQAPLQIVT